MKTSKENIDRTVCFLTNVRHVLGLHLNRCGGQHYQGSHLLDNNLADRSFHGTEQGTCVQQLSVATGQPNS